jgi:hypothetical protein
MLRVINSSPDSEGPKTREPDHLDNSMLKKQQRAQQVSAKGKVQDEPKPNSSGTSETSR